MCTVSWLIDERGYELFDNRDELRRRLPAAPPRLEVLDGVRALTPVDGDAGGTWIGVNEFGLALTLLNSWHLHLDEPRGGFVSRGGLTRSLLDAPSVEDVRRRLRATELPRYRGFRLAAFELGASAPTLFAWNGAALEEELPALPLVSSSLDPECAFLHRRETLERLGRAGERSGASVLERFHASHLPERGPWSVCMHREDAHTVSASHVRVRGGAVGFRYAPGAPCRTPWGEPLGLPVTEAAQRSAS